MSDVLSFDLQWEGDNWRPKFQGLLEPNLRSALEMSIEGVEANGLSISGEKVVSILKVSESAFINPDFPVAYTSSADGFTLCFDRKEIRSSKQFATRVSAAGSALHELIHCNRFQYFPDLTIAEYLASEGLAHYGQMQFLEELEPVEGWTDNFYTWLGIGESPDSFDLKTLVKRYYDDTTQQIEEGMTIDEFAEIWGPGHKDGLILGYLSVAECVKQGRTIEELCQADPFEITEVLVGEVCNA